LPGTGGVPLPGTGGVPLPGTGGVPLPGTGGVPLPGTGGVPFPNQPAPFPAWTGQNAVGGFPGPAGPAVPGASTSHAGPPTTPMVPVAGPRTAKAPGPPWELSRQTGPLPVLPAGRDPTSAGPDQGGSGLPRRVRQANLAPELRAEPPRRLAPTATAGLTGGPTPAEIRQTMSALRRDWDEGRAQQTAGQGAAPGTGADQEPGAGEQSGGT